MIDFKGLQIALKESELADWSHQLPQLLKPILEEYHGDKARWQKALEALPEIKSPTLDLVNGCVVNGNCDQVILKKALKGLMPWRKGPFQFADILVDTEWRSDWKWDRIAPHIDLTKKRVLDVGCGNGYYGFRMLGAGARFVLGIDPNGLFLHQFSAFKRYAPELPIWQLPWTLEDFTPNLEWFDITFSMGVLYHRRSPIDHLIQLYDTLRIGGTLVLETLVVEGDINTALMPHDRYAQMRNVWFLPSVDALMLWLKRAGFNNIRVADLTKTTIDEQRSTEWMAYQSLKDFLDPDDFSKTVEGYPAPLRVVLLADK